MELQFNSSKYTKSLLMGGFIILFVDSTRANNELVNY
jgi:hypothetical protein